MRVYVVNVLEYDLINSFHLHGNLFDCYPTGTSPRAGGVHGHGDVLPGPARDRSSGASRTPGRFMFHAHQSEFTELGWQGFFEVALMARDSAHACGARPRGCSGSSRCC